MTQAAFDYLKRIDDACRASGAALPSDAQGAAMWSGVGFMVGKNDLIADMDQVVEVLEHVELTRVPAVKPWFKGMANVRGNLLPVVDLGLYLFGEPTRMNTRVRYIVVEGESVNVGLMVGGVLGMRSFIAHQKREFSKKTHEGIRPYLTHAFESADEYWNVFDMSLLVNAEEFNQISAH